MDLASSYSTKNVDLDKKRLAGNMDNGEIAEFKVKLDFVHNLMVNKKQIHFATKVETLEINEPKDVSYTNGNGFQAKIRSSNLSLGNLFRVTTTLPENMMLLLSESSYNYFIEQS